jgi:hypothetical protein
VGETRVDLQHLLEDLRDAYSGALEETILTEAVANALDSGATRIGLIADTSDATLTITDDGRGMQRRELARYHDVASSTKSRGDGIGFAGVGIKLGLLVSRDVITETRRGATHVATRWHLASRHRAPWRWIPPPGLVETRGTAVQLALANPLSTLLDASYLADTLRRHFAPLFDARFDRLLGRHYPHGIRFEINQQPLACTGEVTAEDAPVSIRLGRRRSPSAVGYLERNASPDHDGIAISTFGKVIKRGWDWLGLAPSSHARVGGLIEAPELAVCLTLNKSDFVRTGSRGSTYLVYRKAIQEVVSRQLAAWGDTRDQEQRPRTARLERDLERVLEDLADEFPLLRSLVDRRAGGQKRLPMAGRGDERVDAPLFALVARAETQDGTPESATSPGSEASPGRPADPDVSPPDEAQPPRSNEPAFPDAPGTDPTSSDSSARAETASTGPGGATVRGRRRPARYGLTVQFASWPDDVELGRLVDSTVWINEAHPAFTRAARSRAMAYHTALAVALALAPLAVDRADEHQFITEFLSQWGAAGARS